MRFVASVLLVVVTASVGVGASEDGARRWVEYSSVYAIIAHVSDASIIAESDAALAPLDFRRDSNGTTYPGKLIPGIFADYEAGNLARAMLVQGSRPGCIVFSATNYARRSRGLVGSAAAAIKARFAKAFGRRIRFFADAACTASQTLVSSRAELRPARAVAARVSDPAPRREYIEARYSFLRQHYEPNQPQANGPLSAERLGLLARIVRGDMEEDQKEMWPVVADVIYGKASAIEARLDSGRLCADARFYMEYPYNDFQSLLDVAIKAGQRNVIKVLLSHLPDVNTTEVPIPNGKSIPIEGPLTIAARNGEDDVVRMLLQEGVDVNQRTGFPKNNQTALSAAVYSQDVSTAYLLLTHGADITSVLGPGGTVPSFLTKSPQIVPRMMALRDLLILRPAQSCRRHGPLRSLDPPDADRPNPRPDLPLGRYRKSPRSRRWAVGHGRGRTVIKRGDMSRGS